MKNKNIIILLTIVLAIGIICVGLFLSSSKKNNNLKVDLESLTFLKDNKTEIIKTYTQDDFESFVTDYENNLLPNVYITEFLFDGVSTYKPYDLDDFIENGNEYNVEALDIKAININTTGVIELSGTLTGGMLAINTNNLKEDIHLLLNGVKLDTDSKKVPAIYAYNKDVTFADSKVVIETVKGTKNYLEGGKLKKVSLVAKENINDYTDKYTGDNQTNYPLYNNYYGVYTSSELENILFAKVQADTEDLNDGDPYYFYKASGAISSDIDLTFEGEGYLEVTSKNKEGIEAKGNLTFSGGVGDYVVNSQDDCLNTTTDSREVSNARNTLTIDVNSLYAVVANDADEGDAIDSNGKLIISGGRIVAIAKSGQDAGIDSETGTYINGGTVLATGDMYDQVNSESKQNFMILSFGSRIEEDNIITLLDENDEVIFSYKTDRTYTNLVYSSKDLTERTYYIYKDGEVKGEENKGFYTSITSYTKGTQLAYTNKGSTGMMDGNGPMGNGGGPDDLGNIEEENQYPPTWNGGMDSSTDDGNRPTPPERPDKDNGNGTTPPEKPDGSTNENMPFMPFDGNTTATNKEFTIDGISNVFSGVATYTES